MKEDTTEANGWRGTMDAVLGKLRPVSGEPTLYRGWSFKKEEELTKFMEDNREAFTQNRVGMAASIDLDVTGREKFTDGAHAMIWQIQGTGRAVDARPLFAAVGAAAHKEREEEFIIPRGGVYTWVDREGTVIAVPDSAGKPRSIRLYILQEVKP